MLKIVVPAWEDWDPVKEEFISGDETTLTLEHSLISISKWESKYHRSFMNRTDMTEEESLDYIRFMTISQPNHKIKDEVYKHLTPQNVQDIFDYINDPMTATTFSDRNGGKGRREVVTAELVYYWMISLGIPFECQRWHFNRLITLIRVAGIKNQQPKKMSRKDMAAQNRSLNAARRAKHHSRG